MEEKLPKIIVKNSKVHGTGIFAGEDIKKGQKIIEYIGNKLTKAESDKRADEIEELAKKDPERYGSVYIFEVNKKYDIDGSVDWNTARFINHSCDPNCESDIIKERIWVLSIKDIKKGEELNYDYGYDLDNWEDHPCRCGSKKCVGYIVNSDYWPKLKKAIAKKKKKTKTKKNQQKKT